MSSPQTTDDIKKLMIKKFTEVSPWCIRGGIPSHEVIYHVDGTTQMERNRTLKIIVDLA